MTERVKRPKMERTDPIRNWSTLFGGAAAAGESATLNDVVARSVELGYRVVDEYVRQGQKAAARLTGGAGDAEAVTSDMQELSARMAQYASDLTGLWFQTIDAMLANAGGGARPAAPAPSPAAVAGAPAEPVRVRVELASVQPVEVGLDLRPGTGSRPLIVHALRAVDPDRPPIAVSVIPDSEKGAVRLRVHVPDDQPAGVYSGLLIDAEHTLPVGSLSVRVGGG
jgi:hypothetical protein